MSLDHRISALERLTGTGELVRIRVIRGAPEGLSRELLEAWIAAHPECVSKVVECRTGQPRRVHDEADGVGSAE